MEQTRDWKLYEAGKKYNNNLEPNYYDTVTANLEFFAGNQWRNLNVDKLPQPVFNIIKRVVTFQVASLTSSKSKLHFEPLAHTELEGDVMNPANVAKAQVANLFEKFKMDFKIKEALFDAAITGDACAHFYFDMTKKPYGKASGDIKGEISMELVDGSNVFFGNANNNKVEGQPYIIISGRDMVSNLKEEAKRRQTDQNEINNIQSDKKFEEQASDAGKIEVEELQIDGDSTGKALYIIVYRKDRKTGTIKVSKSVENAYIYKDIDTELETYPIAWMNWEKQKNQYHGRAMVTGILPNQIFINRMFAMVMYHLMMTAFPKAVYNGDLLSGWNNEIGSAIPIYGMGPSENIRNVAGYLEPGNMSGQIIQAIELAMAYTKEMLGVSDAALGSIDPKNTSAIIAVQKSTAIPLENPKANLYEWIEDIGRILFDMMGTYYGKRPVYVEVDGKKQVVNFDFDQFKNMWFNIRADVGESSYWSEIAAIQTLDNLLSQQRIEFVDYLERVPDEFVPQKQELISKLKEAMQAAEQSSAQSFDQHLAQLSPQEQQAYMSAPPNVQEQIKQEFLAQQNTQQPTPQGP